PASFNPSAVHQLSDAKEMRQKRNKRSKFNQNELPSDISSCLHYSHFSCISSHFSCHYSHFSCHYSHFSCHYLHFSWRAPGLPFIFGCGQAMRAGFEFLIQVPTLSRLCRLMCGRSPDLPGNCVFILGAPPLAAMPPDVQKVSRPSGKSVPLFRGSAPRGCAA